MSMPIMLAALWTLQTPLAKEDRPDAIAVQSAMNEGVELDFPQYQELSNVTFIRGGGTTDGQWLFVCDAKLVWKLGHAEYFKAYEIAMNKALKRSPLPNTAGFAGNFLGDLSQTALLAMKRELGEFAKGDVITPVRFRVRLERAGEDWIVVESRIIELDTNPLRSFRK